MNDGSTVVVVD